MSVVILRAGAVEVDCGAAGRAATVKSDSSMVQASSGESRSNTELKLSIG